MKESQMIFWFLQKKKQNFPEENCLICPHHGWEGAKSGSKIANLAFCSAVSASNTTI